MHHHGAASDPAVVHGAVAALACTVLVAVAAFHVSRLAGLTFGGRRGFVPAEAGHLAVAAGMAAMFAVPAVVVSPPFAWAWFGAAMVFLVLVVAHPHSCETRFWSCYSMLAIEALAMAWMSVSGTGWRDGAVTGWLVVVFLGAGLVAAGRIIRRWRAPLARDAEVLAPAGSRLAMSAGMLLMLL